MTGETLTAWLAIRLKDPDEVKGQLETLLRNLGEVAAKGITIPVRLGEEGALAQMEALKARLGGVPSAPGAPGTGSQFAPVQQNLGPLPIHAAAPFMADIQAQNAAAIARAAEVDASLKSGIIPRMPGHGEPTANPGGGTGGGGKKGGIYNPGQDNWENVGEFKNAYRIQSSIEVQKGIEGKELDYDIRQGLSEDERLAKIQQKEKANYAKAQEAFKAGVARDQTAAEKEAESVEAQEEKEALAAFRAGRRANKQYAKDALADQTAAEKEAEAAAAQEEKEALAVFRSGRRANKQYAKDALADQTAAEKEAEAAAAQEEKEALAVFRSGRRANKQYAKDALADQAAAEKEAEAAAAQEEKEALAAFRSGRRANKQYAKDALADQTAAEKEAEAAAAQEEKEALAAFRSGRRANKQYAKDALADQTAAEKEAEAAAAQEEKEALAAFRSGRRANKQYAKDALADQTAAEKEAAESPEGKRAKIREKGYMQHATAFQESTEQERLAAGERALENFTERVRKSGESLSIWGQMIYDIGHGSIRRGVATGTTRGLEQVFGEGSSIAGGVGAMTGALASSLALPIAWALGNAIMGLPGTIMQTRGESARFRAAGNTQADEDALGAIEYNRSMYWAAGAKGGRQLWLKESEHLQDIGIDKGKAAKLMDEMLVLGEGTAGGKAFAEQYEQAFISKKSTDVLAIVQSNKFIRDAVLREHPEIARLPEQFQDQRMQELAAQGYFQIEDLDAWMQEASRKGSIPARRVSARANSAEGQVDLWKAEADYDLSHPMENSFEEQEDAEAQARLDIRARRIAAGKDPDIEPDRDEIVNATRHNLLIARHIDLDEAPWEQEGDEGSPRDFRKRRSPGMQYSWSSFSGLADQMQMRWSGAPVDAMASNTSAIGQLTTAVQDNTAAIQDLPSAQIGAGVFVGGPPQQGGDFQ